MKQFRKVIFWCHLAAGVFAGIVVLIMSVTGVLLTYEKQMTSWADMRQYRITPPDTATRLPLETLVRRAREAKPGTPPTAVTFRPDQSAPVAVAFGREGNLFVDPYTGAVLGPGSTRTHDFFHAVTDVHRWLGAHGDGRPIGRAVTGASNLAFLFIVMSGIYLWVPRQWAWKQVKSVLWFRRGLSGKARDFNWHNVIGFWCLVPLFVVVLGAVPISYVWASDLVYRLAGEAPPPPRGPGPPQGPPAGGPAQPRGGAQANTTIFADGLDPLVARAEQHTKGWQSIALQLPTKADGPVTFTVDAGSGGQPQKRAQLTLDRASGDIVRYEPYSSFSRGRQWRTFLRFAHTGEIGGLVGQTLAGLASLGAVFLVWTGLSLSWRRLRSWQTRRTVSASRGVAAAARVRQEEV